MPRSSATQGDEIARLAADGGARAAPLKRVAPSGGASRAVALRARAARVHDAPPCKSAAGAEHGARAVPTLGMRRTRSTIAATPRAAARRSRPGARAQTAPSYLAARASPRGGIGGGDRRRRSARRRAPRGGGRRPPPPARRTERHRRAQGAQPRPIEEMWRGGVTAPAARGSRRDEAARDRRPVERARGALRASAGASGRRRGDVRDTAVPRAQAAAKPARLEARSPSARG